MGVGCGCLPLFTLTPTPTRTYMITGSAWRDPMETYLRSLFLPGGYTFPKIIH
jgi:hypothetical protein